MRRIGTEVVIWRAGIRVQEYWLSGFVRRCWRTTTSRRLWRRWRRAAPSTRTWSSSSATSSRPTSAKSSRTFTEMLVPCHWSPLRRTRSAVPCAVHLRVVHFTCAASSWRRRLGCRTCWFRCSCCGWTWWRTACRRRRSASTRPTST